MPDCGGVSGDQLKSFIERIERLEEEKRALAEDIKEVFAEAKGAGFDTKIMRLIIKERRTDKDDLDEQEALLDVYRRALGMLHDTPLGEAALNKAARRAGKRFVDAMANEDGESVSLISGGKGFNIRNVGGRKIVEPIGEAAE